MILNKPVHVINLLPYDVRCRLDYDCIILADDPDPLYQPIDIGKSNRTKWLKDDTPTTLDNIEEKISKIKNLDITANYVIIVSKEIKEKYPYAADLYTLDTILPVLLFLVAQKELS